ncbi:Hypothetical protein A7982_09220 [Minicystis rosea]|nr:Hypothetical protein A7982_09220 [Minicystis rosea]
MGADSTRSSPPASIPSPCGAKVPASRSNARRPAIDRAVTQVIRPSPICGSRWSLTRRRHRSRSGSTQAT